MWRSRSRAGGRPLERRPPARTLASDYHAHPNAEQIYYILRGQSALVVDGERYPVREGDVLYLPPGAHHRAINEGDDWLEHLIITARLG